MQRRVEQAHHHRASVHHAEHVDEVLRLDAEQLADRFVAHGLVRAQDEVLDDALALSQEHVLGPAQTDGLRPETQRQRGVLGVVGVHPHVVGAPPVLVQANLIGPSEHALEVSRQLGGDEGDRPGDHGPAGAVDRDDVALPQHDVRARHPHLFRGGIDAEALHAAHARRAHAAGDDGGMARLAAMARQDALGDGHALEVVGVRLPAH